MKLYSNLGRSASFEDEFDQQQRQVRIEQEEDSVGDKRQFPKTPHPFAKKMRTDEESPPTMAAASYDDTESPLVEGKELDDTPHEEEEETVEEEEEPDWDKLGENDPTRQDHIQLFLKARELRDETDEKFMNLLDECNTLLEDSKKRILQSVADIHNIYSKEMDQLEGDIKQTMVWNHQVSSKMKNDLEETRNRAQGLFSHLLMSVVNPFAVFAAGPTPYSTANHHHHHHHQP